MSTPGKALVEALSRQLPEHMVWTEAEQATLDLIEQAKDRRALTAGPFRRGGRRSRRTAVPADHPVG
jgi:hypothetical protein